MAFENLGLTKSLEAAADLSSSQFRAVRLNGSGKMALCVAGEASLGALQNKPTAGQQGTYAVDGISRVESGGAFAEMDALASDAQGRYVKATPGAIPIAIAYEAATAAGQIKAALLLPGSAVGGAPYFTLSQAAEAANIIKVTAQLKNADGTNVAVATKARVKSHDAGATLTDGGAGTMLVGTTTTEGIFETDATGALAVDVTDVAAETVYVEFIPEKGVSTFATLVFA